MTREEVKEMLPILQAYAEGRVIECRTKPSAVEGTDVPNEWTGTKEIEFWKNTEYRIKPEPTYRPFKDAEECWNEMLKHQPFGWVNDDKCFYNIVSVSNIDVSMSNVSGNFVTLSFSEVMEDNAFVDGTPFGIKVEDSYR